MIGTARTNPGKGIESPNDLDDPAKTAKLRNVYNAMVDLDIDALISIGGDDTLKTANFLYEYQKRLPAEARRVQVVHLPKTIDNDYRGIDFTFGFFTAVDVMAKEIQNLRADAIATAATSSSRPWAARPGGCRTAWRSPARRTSCSRSRTSRARSQDLPSTASRGCRSTR